MRDISLEENILCWSNSSTVVPESLISFYSVHFCLRFVAEIYKLCQHSKLNSAADPLLCTPNPAYRKTTQFIVNFKGKICMQSALFAT